MATLADEPAYRQMFTTVELTCNNKQHTIQNNEASDLKAGEEQPLKQRHKRKLQTAELGTVYYSTAKMQQFLKNST
jgi:hypothetical protein